jgi:choline-glycine betaine transporter
MIVDVLYMCREVHPTPSMCVLERTTNDCFRTPNDRLTLNLSRMFVNYLRNVRKMTKLVDLYPLCALPINTPYSTSLSAIHLAYCISWLEEISRRRKRVLLLIHLH